MLTLLFLIAGIVAIIIGTALVVVHTQSSSRIVSTTGGIVITVVGVVIILAGFGWREIGPGQVGVATTFGQVQDGTLSPGLRWVIPGVQDVTVFDGRVQAYNFEGIEGATKDLQAVGLSGLINFHIDPSKADKMLQETGGPGEYAQKVFLRPANTALKEVTPQYNASEVISKREEIGQKTLMALQDRMAAFHIIVDRVSVENITLDPEFMSSVEAKQIAQQDLLRADFEQQRAVKLAEGERDARILRAEGEKQANNLINASLTENLLQWTAIQRLSDKIRVMLVPSDQGLIFDLKGLQDEQQP